MQLIFGFIIIVSVIFGMVVIAAAAVIGFILLVGYFVARFKSGWHRR